MSADPSFKPETLYTGTLTVNASALSGTDVSLFWLLLRSAEMQAEREQNGGKISSEFYRSWISLFVGAIDASLGAVISNALERQKLIETFKASIDVSDAAQLVVDGFLNQILAGNKDDMWSAIKTLLKTIVVSNSEYATALDSYLVLPKAVSFINQSYTAGIADLEPLIAETLGVSSHRFDAWVTALTTSWLDALRASAPDAGVYMGAYCWVTDLRPDPNLSKPGALANEAIREAVLADNSGYVYAPSMSHAATAAVLRNGYVSRSGPYQKPYAINLSSACVRTALTLLDGVRAGQPLGALLGYVFERAMHEGHPGLELDQFIDDFRTLYPLVPNNAASVSATAESIAPRSVVDGYKMLKALDQDRTKMDRFTNILPKEVKKSGGESKIKAIISDISRLEEALDALADMQMAELVHQFIAGNTEAASATLDAMSKGALPPEPRIVQTPRWRHQSFPSCCRALCRRPQVTERLAGC